MEKNLTNKKGKNEKKTADLQRIILLFEEKRLTLHKNRGSGKEGNFKEQRVCPVRLGHQAHPPRHGEQEGA